MSPDKRNPDESYEDYKLRLKNQNRLRDINAKGILMWDSLRQGTYRKPMEQ